MAGVHDHKKLDAWKLADIVRKEIRALTQWPAFRTDLDLRRQLRRAAESACPNIAEAFSRYLPRDFARFLRIAKSSLSETIEHVESAVDMGLIPAQDGVRVITFARRARGACTRLICYLETASPPESPAPRSRR